MEKTEITWAQVLGRHCLRKGGASLRIAEAKYLHASYVANDAFGPGIGIKGDYAASHIFVGGRQFIFRT